MLYFALFTPVNCKFYWQEDYVEVAFVMLISWTLFHFLLLSCWMTSRHADPGLTAEREYYMWILIELCCHFPPALWLNYSSNDSVVITKDN